MNVRFCFYEWVCISKVTRCWNDSGDFEPFPPFFGQKGGWQHCSCPCSSWTLSWLSSRMRVPVTLGAHKEGYRNCRPRCPALAALLGRFNDRDNPVETKGKVQITPCHLLLARRSIRCVPCCLIYPSDQHSWSHLTDGLLRPRKTGSGC